MFLCMFLCFYGPYDWTNRLADYTHIFKAYSSWSELSISEKDLKKLKKTL